MSVVSTREGSLLLDSLSASFFGYADSFLLSQTQDPFIRKPVIHILELISLLKWRENVRERKCCFWNIGKIGANLLIRN